MQPKVCIILVNYNSNKDTLECVESLNQITYTNYHIVIVDNASNEIKDLESCTENNSEKVTLLKSKINLGFAGANNIGLKFAKQNKPDYFLLLNNDTSVEPDFLDILVKNAQSDNSAGLVCGKILYYNTPNVIWYAGGEINFKTGAIEHYGCNKRDVEFKSEKRNVTFATGCLWLISSAAIYKVGLLDEKYFLYSEDADYCCRMTAAGFTILYDPKAVIYHKVGASSGKSSLKIQYYSTRNDFIVFNQYAPKNCHSKSMHALMKRKIKDVLAGHLDLKYVVMGYKDYRKGIIGRRDVY